jgi:hypothetical protein
MLETRLSNLRQLPHFLLTDLGITGEDGSPRLWDRSGDSIDGSSKGCVVLDGPICYFVLYG